jgi:hypothetical protein
MDREQVKQELEAKLKGEGDVTRFTVKGFPCVVARHPSFGHLNGYVGIPKSHPLYGKNYEIIQKTYVHGGITYAGQDLMFLTAKEKKYWWFGFDTGHIGDLPPFYLLNRNIPDIICVGVYKDMKYVVKETKDMALQLIKEAFLVV